MLLLKETIIEVLYSPLCLAQNHCLISFYFKLAGDLCFKKADDICVTFEDISLRHL